MTVFLYLSFPFQIIAQHEPDAIYWGFRFGPSYRWFDQESLIGMIVPTYNHGSCTFSEQKTPGLTFGLDFNFRKDGNPFGVELELSYSLQSLGSDIKKGYDLQVTFLNSTVPSNSYFTFNYEYFNMAPVFKIFPIIDKRPNKVMVNNGFQILLGAQLSLAASDKINFWCDTCDPNFILLTRDAYRRSLKGLNYFSFIGGLGWEGIPLFNEDAYLSAEARYYWGLGDSIETQANSLGSIENRNRQHYAELTLIMSFLFYKR